MLILDCPILDNFPDGLAGRFSVADPNIDHLYLSSKLKDDPIDTHTASWIVVQFEGTPNRLFEEKPLEAISSTRNRWRQLRNSRDLAMISILFGCGLRRAELSSLQKEDIQIRQGHWAIVDLVGKGEHIRTVPMPIWVKSAVDRWMSAATVAEGRIFRAVSRHGSAWSRGVTESVVWYAVRDCARRLQLDRIAPHDLRRPCAKLCHASGGELEQIQFVLGHASVLTT
jgi:site-specific recombinase XerD